jgi:S-adenosylmethionine hydrolase
MKGVILQRARTAQLVDLTHEVPPQSVLEGAFLLETAWRYFPAGTVFLVVVDPGVGSARRRLAVQAGGMTFIGPDNGSLSCVLSDELRGRRENDRPYEPARRPVEPGTAVSIEGFSRLGSSSVSATFEGRDVFAPAAGFIAAGGNLHDLGPAVQEIDAYPAFRAPKHRPGFGLGNVEVLRSKDAYLSGVVIHVDSFGNLITDIRASDIEGTPRFVVRGVEVPLVRTYAEAPEGKPVALAGSSGFIEVAVANASAADVLEAAAGIEVDEL